MKADLGGEDSRWLIVEDGFTAALAGTCETLFTTGNGYLGTRGSLAEGHEGALPGTFLRGVFDHHDSAVPDLVKAPDWLSLAVVVNGVRLDVTSVSVIRGPLWADLAWLSPETPWLEQAARVRQAATASTATPGRSRPSCQAERRCVSCCHHVSERRPG